MEVEGRDEVEELVGDWWFWVMVDVCVNGECDLSDSRPLILGAHMFKVTDIQNWRLPIDSSTRVNFRRNCH